MTERSLKIFVVDDDPVARMVASGQLAEEGGYEVLEFDSGTALLAAIDEAPDVILLDVAMPGIDGIDTCRVLRATGNDHAQVLFVSGHDDLEMRMAAYQAGGSDFIVKPYLPEELAQKMRMAERALANRRSLSHQAQYAQQAAFTAMSSLGEMGVVLQFLRTSYACGNPAQLAAALFEALAQYGLQGLLGIRLADGNRCFSSRGECSPLEQSILGHAQGMERIFQLGDRVAINYPAVTLLALDLPVDDPERVGRLRDHLTILMEGAEGRMQAMASEAMRLAQAGGISQAVADLTQALADIDRMQAGSRVQAMEIGSAYLQRLTGAFVHLGLSEDQEAALAGMAQDAYARLDTLMDEGRFIGDLLREVTAHLRRLVQA